MIVEKINLFSVADLNIFCSSDFDTGTVFQDSDPGKKLLDSSDSDPQHCYHGNCTTDKYSEIE
jgi:hypothetical protein